MIKRVCLLLAASLLLLTGCSPRGQVMDGEDMVRSYTQISQETAKEMMAKDDGHIIVDVRRQDEFNSGHIPGAVCIPNESIGTAPPEMLPDPDQIILIYCRTGRRSKEAAQKLFDMGYSNVYEFGGIQDWTGEVTAPEPESETEPSGDKAVWPTDEIPVSVRYDRMWIYGASAESSDPEIINAIVEAVKNLKVGPSTNMVVDDYTDILTFTFQDGGMHRLEFEDQIWVVSADERYIVEGLSQLREILDQMLGS